MIGDSIENLAALERYCALESPIRIDDAPAGYPAGWMTLYFRCDDSRMERSITLNTQSNFIAWHVGAPNSFTDGYVPGARIAAEIEAERLAQEHAAREDRQAPPPPPPMPTHAPMPAFLQLSPIVRVVAPLMLLAFLVTTTAQTVLGVPVPQPAPKAARVPIPGPGYHLRELRDNALPSFVPADQGAVTERVKQAHTVTRTDSKGHRSTTYHSPQITVTTRH
jgi:hypothetical protein